MLAENLMKGGGKRVGGGGGKATFVQSSAKCRLPGIATDAPQRSRVCNKCDTVHAS